MTPPGPASRRARAPRKPPPPLDRATLDAIAVRYVERFQTTRARLVRYLRTKLRQRGWPEDAPPPDVEGVADRLVARGYVDDRAFAQARVRGLTRRGMGQGRIRAALHASGVATDDQAEALEGHDALASALDFARRKRIGPFGPSPADSTHRRRQFAAMARAGHAPAIIARILGAETEEDLPEATGSD